MPIEPTPRNELLERIITAGNRRRRRLLIVPGAALTAIAVLVFTLAAGDGGDRQLVTADDEQTTTTTTETTTTESTTSTEPVPEPTSTTTTEAPPVCRNSRDPRCGPFYWDYDPATFPNAPLELSVTSSPEPAVAGEPVSFAIRFYDPDMPWADNCATASFPGSTSAGSDDDVGYSEPDGDYMFFCAMPSCALRSKRYGPWDPPPPTASEPRTRTVTRIYEEPGDYAVRIDAHTGFTGCGAFEGYHSRASLTVQIHVDPAPPL